MPDIVSFFKTFISFFGLLILLLRVQYTILLYFSSAWQNQEPNPFVLNKKNENNKKK